MSEPLVQSTMVEFALLASWCMRRLSPSRRAQKGNLGPRWTLGIMVTKCSLDDLYVIAGKDGIRPCRSVRSTGQAWL